MKNTNQKTQTDDIIDDIKVDQQVQTQPQTTGISQWLFTANTPNVSDSLAKRDIRPIPIRSVSTINFRDVKESKKIVAAPFPSLPSRRDVQEMKSQTEQEIQRYKADLSSLQHERNSLQQTPNQLIPSLPNSLGIHQYRGLLISDNLIDSVISTCKSRRDESHNTTTIQSDNQTYHNLPELPLYKQTIDQMRLNALPIFAHRFAKKGLLIEEQQNLADEYAKRRMLWEQQNIAIDDYSSRVDIKSNVWPPEFPKETPVVDEAARLKWASPDQEMFLMKSDKIDNCYYNTNGFINDPIASYNRFKERLAWTEEEKQIFVEKYRQNPKKFRKIKEALPDKSYKDVIEFYYLNRYELGLRENEGISKKRGGRRKVISEGSTKKYY
ncbi:Myb-like DNA-binding domain containing protein [Histomonas meleagridis]|uniref:Myb-like DNA-binding domain containing protein n=1 Tax=Histomonas meleagridis TaxID=135588 RepID=UPI00355A9812|nr:Myb-like DNA-binding domain containing protein [Histomonas meleagridis]KAH0805894.1 Myb-like DNA-binding domain containing protein [Histomonas meleagridis]